MKKMFFVPTIIQEECVVDVKMVFVEHLVLIHVRNVIAIIVLYAILGIVRFLFKFSVTLYRNHQWISNVMSINEQLFFNTQISRFSILRVFISLINLDLGFEICFYDGMSQLAKTGLQFLFPVYLWLFMLIITYVGKLYFCVHKLSSYSALPVLGTLILLAYSKLLAYFTLP